MFTYEMTSDDRSHTPPARGNSQEWNWSKGETNVNKDVSKHRGAGLPGGKKQIRAAKIASKRAARASKSDTLDDYFDMKAFGAQLYGMWNSIITQDANLPLEGEREEDHIVFATPAIQPHARDVLHRMGKVLKVPTRERGSGGAKAKRRVEFLIPKAILATDSLQPETAYARILELAGGYEELVRGDNVESVLADQKDARKYRREKKQSEREGSSRFNRKMRQLFVPASDDSTASSSDNEDLELGKIEAVEENKLSTAMQGISFVCGGVSTLSPERTAVLPLDQISTSEPQRSQVGGDEEEDLDAHIGLGFRPPMFPVAEAATSQAEWEHHTTGIGSKLLQKMGYQGKVDKLPASTQRVMASWDDEGRAPKDRRGLGH